MAFKKLCGLKMGEGVDVCLYEHSAVQTQHRHTHDLANIITVLGDLVQPSFDVDK